MKALLNLCLASAMNGEPHSDLRKTLPKIKDSFKRWFVLSKRLCVIHLAVERYGGRRRG